MKTTKDSESGTTGITEQIENDWIMRLMFAMSTRKMSKTDVARAAGINAQVLINAINKKQKNLSAIMAVKIAAALNVSTDWLIGGVGMMETGAVEGINTKYEIVDPNYFAIRESAIDFACGGVGGQTSEPNIEEIQDSIPVIYRADFFQSNRLNPKFCRRFRVTGDSMEPLILDGDYILVNLAPEVRERIKNGTIYALWYDGTLLCKYLAKQLNGNLLISSENPKYPPEEVEKESADRLFYIIGEVIERSGKITR